jgi:hypothetical protein
MAYPFGRLAYPLKIIIQPKCLLIWLKNLLGLHLAYPSVIPRIASDRVARHFSIKRLWLQSQQWRAVYEKLTL